MIIGFIGTGHMGGSLATILGKGSKDEILLCNRTKEKAERLARAIGPNARLATIEEIAEKSDYVFLGVKPKDLDDLLSVLPRLNGVAVSMVAGVALAEIEPFLQGAPLLRILPNTPVAVGKGFTLVCFDDSFTKAEKDAFFSWFAPTGKAVEVEEDKLNPGGVITGSAPAYLDYFIDALIRAGMEIGLNESEATEYVLSMCEGAVALAKESGKSPGRLGEEVCSPGGSTIEGVKVLLSEGLYDTVAKATKATYEKNKKMR